jgi:hypothetical protein
MTSWFQVLETASCRNAGKGHVDNTQSGQTLPWILAQAGATCTGLPFFLSHYIAFLFLQNSTLPLEEVTNVVNNQSTYLTLTLFSKQSALLCEMFIVDKSTLSFNIIFSSFSGLV